MSRLEVAVSSDSAELAEQLRAIDELPEPEKTAAMGHLLLALGALWIAKAARADGRHQAFAHNRRRRRTG